MSRAMPEKADYLFLVQLIGIVLVLATVSNGIGSYLRKTGVVDRPSYDTFWKIHCEHLNPERGPQTAEPRCCADLPPRRVKPEQQAVERGHARYVYEVPGWEFALKRVKDALWLMLIGLSAYLIATRGSTLPSRRAAWPIAILLTYVALIFLFSLAHYDPRVAAAGLWRSFAFIALALVGRWLVPHMSPIANVMGGLLLLELALAPFEMWQGIHLHGHLSPMLRVSRASGTLVLPNSLGVFAAVSVAFYYAFSRDRAHLRLFGVAALALVVASGSATGMVCAVLFPLFIVLSRVKGYTRAPAAIAGVALGVVALVLLLPTLTGRPDLFTSVLGAGGRTAELHAALAEPSLPLAIFGHGTGINPMLPFNMLGDGAAKPLGDAVRLVMRITDSTITGLVVQVGILGALLFYAVLFWAGLRDRTARVFYLVAGLCSLTMNITELFPVNLMLGLALAHSVWKGGRQ